jgi:hypothetical protein
MTPSKITNKLRRECSYHTPIRVVLSTKKLSNCLLIVPQKRKRCTDTDRMSEFVYKKPSWKSCQIFSILPPSAVNSHTLPVLQLESKCGDWRIWHIGARSANPLTLEDFYWLLLWTAFLLVQCKLMNIHKLASGEEQGPSSWGVV